MPYAAFLLSAATLVALAAATPVGAAAVSEAAPAFEADSSIGRISLADYQGKRNVLLAFYFADFTAG